MSQSEPALLLLVVFASGNVLAAANNLSCNQNSNQSSQTQSTNLYWRNSSICE